MIRTLPFIKAHGCENSFVLLDLRRERSLSLGKLAAKLCDKAAGIGADGLIGLASSSRADFRMKYYNADGSPGEMCGNGVRCLALLIREWDISQARSVSFETGAGIIRVSYAGRSGGAEMFEVDMGAPRFNSKDFRVPKSAASSSSRQLSEVTLRGRRYALVSMGNPHAITFVTSDIDPALEGPWIEQNEKLFPNGTNVEFVRVLSRSHLKVRVWERGCGVTRACGTGACAAVVAAVSKGLVRSGPVKVSLDGGSLLIEWQPDGGTVSMTGPAVLVAEGKTRI
ncbi:MAG: diaminopimelate epimerase [Oligoflexia bacterium]|nr:diaminopimelate epimerase [Oligoflexia bacterium]